MEELKIIQEAENKLENRMKLRSAKNISQETIDSIDSFIPSINRSIYVKNNISIFNI